MFGASAVTNMLLVMKLVASAVYSKYAPNRRAVPSSGRELYNSGICRTTGKTVPALRAVAEAVNGASAEIGERDGVAEAERAVTEQTHQVQGDALAQPGLRVPEREHVAGEDEPHRRVAESAERPLGGLRGRVADEAEHRGGNDAAHADDRRWNRLGDEPDDHRREEREVAPGVNREPGRHRCQGHCGADGERDDRLVDGRPVEAGLGVRLERCCRH